MGLSVWSKLLLLRVLDCCAFPLPLGVHIFCSPLTLTLTLTLISFCTVEFFAAHPEYANLPFFVFGESYGGHYAPNVAYRVMQGNQEDNGFAKINLKGLAVGNGLTDPAVQYKYYAQMA